MKESIMISILIIIIYIFFINNKTDLILFEHNGNKVLVRDTPNSADSAILLGELINRLYILRNYLVNNKNQFPEYNEYLNLLETNFTKSRTSIYENSTDSNFTSYSVNKGEELVFCLRCKDTHKLHSINLLVYVAVHEMAHTACPEIGHPPLFNKIFKFLLEQAVQLNLYIPDDYSSRPVQYCGMKLYTNVLF
jgi:hypothetical protein